MVRNPRTLMMCSLLAVATGMALGSRMAPTAVDMAMGPAAMPRLAGRIEAWLQHDTSVVPPAAAPMVVAGQDDGAHVDATLEGHRQPRGPRTSREGTARTAR